MTSADMSAKRRSLLIRLTVIVALFLGIGGAWHYFVGSRQVETDNAYVGADSAEIMALVSGPVASVNVEETQTVKAGDILLTIDKADSELKLRMAQATLEQARRAVQQARGQTEALISAVETARADLARTAELARRGNAPQQTLQHAQDTVQAAESQLLVNRTIAGDGEIDEQPGVQLAQVAVDTARLDLERTTIRSPIDGIVAKRNVQVGQYITPNMAVMAVVPVHAAYVDANFKESQLDRVKIGQPVELVSDLYGSSVVYHGRVTGLGGGTGSAFALIPAQNATGNWIKIVQRLPVRITLDPQELEKHPLRVGLSMTATIDITAPSTASSSAE